MENGKHILKISDFGLSKTIYSEMYYTTNKEQKIAVKWYFNVLHAQFIVSRAAPEVLLYGKFSTGSIISIAPNYFELASDVWSFGITIWEIFVHGAFPYPAMSNLETIEAVIEGYRLPQPVECPDSIWEIIERCWLEVCNTVHILFI
jgi:serine/threonine protein kinase